MRTAGRQGRGVVLGVVLLLCAAATAWVATRPAPFALRGDNATLTHPLLVDATRQVRAGHLPLWTTGRWGGSPLVGDPVVGALYPPYWLAYGMTAAPHWRAPDVLVIFHLLVLLAGTAWLLRSLGVRPAGTSVTLLLLTLNPTVVLIARSWIQYWAAMACWPWLLGAARRTCDDTTRGWRLVAAAALAAQVYAGYPQFAVYSGTVALVWAVTTGRRPLRQRLWEVACIGAGAIALCAPVIIAAWDTVAESMRGGPEAAARLAALRAFAIPLRAWPQVVDATPWLPKVLPAALGMACLGTLRGGRATLVLGGLAAVAMLAATGGSVYDAVQALPHFGWFAGPVKFFYVALFLLLVLAGVGLDGAIRHRVGAAAVIALSLPSLLGLGSAGLALALVAAALAVAVRWPVAASAGILTAASLAFLVSSRALVAGDLFSRGPFDALVRPGGTPQDPGQRVLALAGGQHPDVVGLNYGALWNVPSPNGVGPLGDRTRAAIVDRPLAAPHAMAAQLGVDVVLVAAPDLRRDLLARGAHDAGRWRRLWRLTLPRPPAHAELMRRGRAVPTARVVAAARHGRALGRGRVLLEGAPVAHRAGDRDGSVAELGRRPGFARYRVTVDRPTWLVVRESWARGWRARIDGAPAPVRRAAGLFLGVRVPAGTHEVTLAFAEPGLGLAALLALAALVLLDLGRRPPLQPGHDDV